MSRVKIAEKIELLLRTTECVPSESDNAEMSSDEARTGSLKWREMVLWFMFTAIEVTLGAIWSLLYWVTGRPAAPAIRLPFISRNNDVPHARKQLCLTKQTCRSFRWF